MHTWKNAKLYGDGIVNNKTFISAVQAVGHKSVRLTWKNGDQDIVDLSGVLDHAVFDHIRASDDEFGNVKSDDYGASIFWSDEAEISYEQLDNLATEQAAGNLKKWIKKHRMTYDKAAHDLGIARRTFSKYANGEIRIPKAIKLACKALDEGLSV